MKRFLLITIMLLIHPTLSVAMAPMEKGEKDYYAILGIERTAKPDEIRSAYRKLALKYHPDKIQEELEKQGHITQEQMLRELEKATEKFQLIQEAHRVLITEQEREAYNKWYDRKKFAAGAQPKYAEPTPSVPTPSGPEIRYEENVQSYLDQLKAILKQHARTTNLEINKYALDEKYIHYIENVMDFLDINYKNLSTSQLKTLIDLLHIAFIVKPIEGLGELTQKIHTINLKLGPLPLVIGRMGYEVPNIISMTPKGQDLSAYISSQLRDAVDRYLPRGKQRADVNKILCAYADVHKILSNPINMLIMMYSWYGARDALIDNYVRLAKAFLQIGDIEKLREVITNLDTILTDLGINFPVDESLRRTIVSLKRFTKQEEQ